MNKKVILFIPVSAPGGIGEYIRSVIIAEHISKKWPDSDIHFIINQNSLYINNCPFNTHLSRQSATKDTPKVKQVIDDIKPDLVIFDCAGRGQ